MIDFIKIPEKMRNVLKKKPEIREKIEKNTKTKLRINEDILIEGDSFDVFRAKNVLKAFGRGFDINDSLKLLEDEYGLEIINLSDFVKSKNKMRIIKGRVIGSKGKTKKYIEIYTNSKISIFGKTISIIAKWNDLAVAKEGIMMILKGSSHQTLYRWLEQRMR